MHSRRQFLKKTTLAASAFTFSGILACAQKQRPNVVWLISEDTSPDLSCYGNTNVQTPHLDKLASQGMRFENAYATAPVCSPSRSAFMTGMWQTSIGAHQHRTFQSAPLPEPVKVITEYFRQAGYYVSNGRGTDAVKPGKTDWNFKIDNPAFDGTDWSGRAEGQPFFAQFNFSLTHRVFQRDSENPIDENTVKAPPYYPDHPLTRRDWANYLESLQVLDRQIGAVLQRLEDEGLTENTIVIYFGDHGRPMVRGKQWLYEGGIRVPMILRWPGKIKSGSVNTSLVSLIDLAPTCLKAIGEKPPVHLQGFDFLGRFSKKRKQIFAARDRCDGTVDRIRCVREGHFKLIKNYYPELPYTQFNGYKKFRYPVLTLMQVLHEKGELTPHVEKFMAPTRPALELYDLATDPDELTNLADDPNYVGIKSSLLEKLETWIAETDNGIYPEEEYKIKSNQDLMAEKFIERMQDYGISADISDQDFLAWWKKRVFSNEH